MSALPEYMIPIFATFAPVFSNPVWANAQLLLIGAILCRGRRTVAAALRVMGRAEEAHFVNYHRVLNRAVWSALQGGQILLGLLVALLPASVPVIVGIDETLERRGGKRIKAKGVYRDAVRSSKKNTVHCFGLKWISMMLLVPMPWASGVWALPFLTILAPSKKANEKAGRRHKTTLDWARQMMLQLRRWLPDRAIILIGDGTYACVRFALACKQHSVVLVSRLRLDARLFDFPGPQPKSKRGPKPKKGKRLDSLKQRAQDPGQPWRTATVRWYGGQRKEVIPHGHLSVAPPGRRPRGDTVCVGARGHQRPGGVFQHRSGDGGAVDPGLLCAALACGGNLRGGTSAPGAGDPAAVVRQGHCPEHACVIRLVLARDAVGLAPAGGAYAGSGGMVSQGRSDLLGCVGVGTS